MKVYIAGPMKGMPDRNEPAFRHAAKLLIMQGHYPISPLDVHPSEHSGPCPDGYDFHDGHSSSCYLRTDIRALTTCDGIQLLHGWMQSTGARIEFAVAEACCLTVLHPGDLDDFEGTLR